MCECGCSELNAQWRMPAPDGKWYVIGIHDGCFDCDSPAGVDMSLFTVGELEEYGHERLPILDTSNPMIGIGVLHWQKLRDRLVGFFAETPLDADESMDEVAIEDALKDTFQQAVADTGKEYQPAIKKARRRG